MRTVALDWHRAVILFSTNRTRPSWVLSRPHHGSPHLTSDQEDCQQLLVDDARIRIPFAEDFVPA
jgi:hypothetical protein